MKKLGNFELDKIYYGDCLELMKDLPNNSIDLILTDPPYFLPAKHYKTRKHFKRNLADLGILEGFFKNIFKEFDRILKQDGLLYMFCDGQSYPLFYYYAYPIMKTVRPLIWDKKVSFSGYYWRHQHEIILFGVRPEKHKIPTGKGDVLKCRAVKVDKRQHPAQKPTELLVAILENTSRKGDIILDPFIGSGTTAVACREIGRHFLGFEISPEYIEIANRRLSEVQVSML